jgi:hypothetical protein
MVVLDVLLNVYMVVGKKKHQQKTNDGATLVVILNGGGVCEHMVSIWRTNSVCRHNTACYLQTVVTREMGDVMRDTCTLVQTTGETTKQ